MSALAKKTEKKMKILDTAFSLFKDYTVTSIAIDDIVKAAGIARGTFYLYFMDKNDLLEQIIIYKSTEYMKTVLRKTISGKLSDEKEFYVRLRVFLNCFIDFLTENRDMLPIMTKNLSSCIKNLPDLYDDEIKNFYEYVLSFMETIGYSPKMAHMTIFIVIDMVGSVCSDAILHKKPYPIDEIRETVIESAICIFKSNKDIKMLDTSSSEA
ncbi:MAG: TetR/AcrR family transcriptional regulator [Clostridia bacterium]|nr:TetR/AcrR family transcriptional regulator [Clostridia bacterium]